MFSSRLKIFAFRDICNTNSFKRFRNFTPLRTFSNHIRTEFYMEKTTTNKINVDFELSAKENSLFSLLMQILQDKNLQVTLRVAGGWVRDKLLGKDSHDIDIAQDTMMGEAFAKVVSDYIKEKGLATGKGFGVIKANPDKSKHLETATINIDGDWIDFVNLRKEDYTEDNRFPTIENGTPEEDAYRRDLTINSLFYNINDGKVEDFTKKGQEDLKNGLIRTPIEPLVTFLDDPLRILRTFRFAARFNFKIVDEIFEALKNEEIQKIFTKKISKERVGSEFKSSFSRPGSIIFLQMLEDCKFLKFVFWTEMIEFEKLDEQLTCGQQLAYKTEDQILNNSYKHLGILNDGTYPTSKLQLYYLMSSLLYGLQFFPAKLGKAKPITLIEYVLRENLKFSNEEVKDITELTVSAEKLMQIITSSTSENELVSDAAFWIKNNAKSLWEIAFVLCMAKYPVIKSKYSYEECQEIIYKYDVQKFHQKKPMLDGNELKTIINVKGAEIKKYLDVTLRYQTVNPNCTKEEVTNFVKKYQIGDQEDSDMLCEDDEVYHLIKKKIKRDSRN